MKIQIFLCQYEKDGEYCFEEGKKRKNGKYLCDKHYNKIQTKKLLGVK